MRCHYLYATVIGRNKLDKHFGPPFSRAKIYAARVSRNNRYLVVISHTMWVLNKAGVKRELLDTVKARKLAYYGHTMRKQESCLDGQHQDVDRTPSGRVNQNDRGRR